MTDTPHTVDLTPAGLSPDHPQALANAQAAQEAAHLLEKVVPERKVALFDQIVQDFGLTPDTLRDLLYLEAVRQEYAHLPRNERPLSIPSEVVYRLRDQADEYAKELASIQKQQNAAGEQLVAALGGRL